MKFENIKLQLTKKFFWPDEYNSLQFQGKQEYSTVIFILLLYFFSLPIYYKIKKCLKENVNKTSIIDSCQVMIIKFDML